MIVDGAMWRERLRDLAALSMIGAAFAMKWRILGKAWQAASSWPGCSPPSCRRRLGRRCSPRTCPRRAAAGDAAIGPLVAMLSFVCFIGNVPLAGVLWGGGVGFAGVLAFLYADLSVLPLIDAYRRYFDWRMALGIAATLYLAMVAAALVVGGGFQLASLLPPAPDHPMAALPTCSLDYTFYLNVAAIILTA